MVSGVGQNAKWKWSRKTRRGINRKKGGVLSLARTRDAVGSSLLHRFQIHLCQCASQRPCIAASHNGKRCRSRSAPHSRYEEA